MIECSTRLARWTQTVSMLRAILIVAAFALLLATTAIIHGGCDLIGVEWARQ